MVLVESVGYLAYRIRRLDLTRFWSVVIGYLYIGYRVSGIFCGLKFPISNKLITKPEGWDTSEAVQKGCLQIAYKPE